MHKLDLTKIENLSTLKDTINPVKRQPRRDKDSGGVKQGPDPPPQKNKRKKKKNHLHAEQFAQNIY